MAGTFSGNMERLAERVGHGDLVVKVKVDQVYAAYQHFRVELRHPRGGRAHYLDEPLHQNAPSLIRQAAEGLLDPGGPVPVMARVGERVAGYPRTLAPVELNNLRRSASVKVIDNGQPAYDRPATVPRLTGAELREQRRQARKDRRRG